MAYREFTWKGYTLTMADVREIAQIQETVQPPEGKVFLQVTLRLAQELMQNVQARGELFCVLLKNGIPVHNMYYRINAQENLYACIFTLAKDYRLKDYEFSVSGAESAEIEAPDKESALPGDIFDSEDYEWVTGLDQRI